MLVHLNDLDGPPRPGPATVAELAEYVTTSTDYPDAEAITDILAELDKLSDEEAIKFMASLDNT